MTPVRILQGDGPIVLGVPHASTFVPEEIFAKLTPHGRRLSDTDWHVDRLYDGLLNNVTFVQANFHRYVIDANRAPSGESLYPGQNTTGLVPLTNFDGQSIWSEPPSKSEISLRHTTFHSAYHSAMKHQLHRVRDLHGFAILYDCHSIRSRVPFLFDGQLPDFNIGTNFGTSCSPTIEHAVAQACKNATGYHSVTNGRFVGGWTTRHYGQPKQNIHAIQMELAQSTYLKSETAGHEYDIVKANRLRRHLKNILQSLLISFKDL